VQILRALRASLADDGWERANQAAVDALTSLLDTSHPAAPGEFQLFESTLQLLSCVCDKGPTAVLVDDLQWATRRRWPS
jgi:hypothetical protein